MQYYAMTYHCMRSERMQYYVEEFRFTGKIGKDNPVFRKRDEMSVQLTIKTRINEVVKKFDARYTGIQRAISSVLLSPRRRPPQPRHLEGFSEPPPNGAFLTATNGQILAIVPVEGSCDPVEQLVPAEVLKGRLPLKLGKKRDLWSSSHDKHCLDNQASLSRFPNTATNTAVLPENLPSDKYSFIGLDAKLLLKLARAVDTEGRIGLFIPKGNPDNYLPAIVVGNTGIGAIMNNTTHEEEASQVTYVCTRLEYVAAKGPAAIRDRGTLYTEEQAAPDPPSTIEHATERPRRIITP
jgi:hypothetical protein